MNLFLFLDFDGTLTPIVGDPGAAALSRRARSILRKLAKADDVRVAIVSGRSLNDLKKRVAVRGIIYVGNHGLETEGVHPFVHCSATSLAAVRRIGEGLRQRLRETRGIFVEDKGMVVTLHFRKAAASQLPAVFRIFAEEVQPYLHAGAITVNFGKKVLEVKPNVPWNKGKAVLWLLSRYRRERMLPVYIGDDVTDEDAFRALSGRGIAIRVGDNDCPAAPYALKDPNQVLRFLALVAA